eukprot:TRINITY_DN185_c0_g1_i4.p2 TRINITY_DN185_c0_g1~~TRINITY_DN185_c0_g1_i4.p2  ORF type:complete len:314 (+),score=101.24 TRINITY_DN185_c0_g1_i4:63-944(+)
MTASKKRIVISKLGKPLGSGQFGQVCAALSEEGSQVAVKVFKNRKAGQQEMSVLAELSANQHSNVVRFLGESDGGGAVLEIAGCSLDQAVRRGPVPERWWRRYFGQVAGALAHVHSLGIMHLDVKAANILLSTPQAEPLSVAKLTDFGVSRRVADSSAPRCPVGTPCFMAPEAAGGEPSAASDVWSLGVVGLEVVHRDVVRWWLAEHGRDNDEEAVVTARARSTPPSIPERLHPLTQSFLRSCLQIDPSDRPSAAELTRHEWFAADDECFDGAECARRTPRGAWSSTAGSASS